ncbi:MAG: hypothetical protein ABIF28_09220 [Pseudomonadota bacterium]
MAFSPRNALLLLVSLGLLSVSFSTRAASENWGVTRVGPMLFGAQALNNAGQVATVDLDPLTGMPRAVVWQNAALSIIGFLPGGSASGAFGINNLGHVVGTSTAEITDALGNTVLGTRAFVAEKGAMTALESLPGGVLDDWAYDISDSGYIVGSSRVASGNRAVMWKDGRVMDLGSSPELDATDENYSASRVNNGGQAIGSMWSSSGNFLGFVWTDGKMTDLGEWIPSDINDSGFVTLTRNFRNADGHLEEHAGMWQDGYLTDLGTFGGQSARFNGINQSGQVVGSGRSQSGLDYAFVWNNGVVRDLNSIAEISMHGVVFTSALSINERGEMLALSNDGFVYLISSVPEPETYASLLAGLICVGAFTRGSRK